MAPDTHAGSGAAPGTSPGTRPDTWARFAAAFHEHSLWHPNACVELGADCRLDELPDPSTEGAEAHTADARRLLEDLDALDQIGADFDTVLDADLARLTLQAQIHRDTYRFNGRTVLAQQPTAGMDIGDGIFPQFINDPRPDAERLATITARLEKVPDYCTALLARLDTPVARWVAMDREQVEGLPQFFDTLVGWAREVSYPDLPRLERASARATDALKQYSSSLGALPTTTQLHIDESDARQIVALAGIDKSLDDLHGMAAGYLAETGAEIERLRARLVEKYKLPADTTADALTEFLAERFAVTLPTGALEDVLERYEQERRKILAFIRERDLFPVPEAQDMRILRTPGFMTPTIPAGAMMPPPPFRPGVRTSLVYLTLSEELLAEHTELSIPGMMIHEGIPGHHLQLSTAGLLPSVVRRHFNGNHHAEGWTTMLEDYMLDMGYMGDLVDEARFVGKRDISRIGARVAIDLFFMTGDKSYLEVGVPCDLSSDDPFIAAGNLLGAVTGFVPGRVQAELNWYSQERGYPLSYLTGNRMVWELKHDVAAASGLTGLELDRRFHTIYLESGNMPLTFLRRVFEHEGLLG
jgi:uncharacterized protein (DUF885 family)